MAWLTEHTDLYLLFFTGFLSATLLPGGSETHLVWLINQEHYALWLLVFIATLGNTLGGMTNYLIGRCFPLRTKKDKWGQKSVIWLQKYGYFALLLSWLPLVGDPLCLAAGWLRLKQTRCWLFIALGKGIRYSLLALLTREIILV